MADYSVQMTIENQPIIPNGYDTANIFYNIRMKSHDSENWVNTTVPDPSKGIRGYIGEIGTSGSTVIVEGFNAINFLLGLPNGSHQIDYQVEAINGYLNTTPVYVPPIGVDPNSTPVIVVNTSGWSDTQTIMINDSSSTPNLSTTANPNASDLSNQNYPSPTNQSGNGIINQVDFFWMDIVIIALLAVIVVLLIANLLYARRKSSKQTQAPSNTSVPQ
jgi:hypothetical protein